MAPHINFHTYIVQMNFPELKLKYINADLGGPRSTGPHLYDKKKTETKRIFQFFF